MNTLRPQNYVILQSQNPYRLQLKKLVNNFKDMLFAPSL